MCPNERRLMTHYEVIQARRSALWGASNCGLRPPTRLACCGDRVGAKDLFKQLHRINQTNISTSIEDFKNTFFIRSCVLSKSNFHECVHFMFLRSDCLQMTIDYSRDGRFSRKNDFIAILFNFSHFFNMFL